MIYVGECGRSLGSAWLNGYSAGGCRIHILFILLWPPYGIEQAIIFLPCGFFLLSLWSPYVIGQTIIFLPCGFFFLLSFFPRLISAAADWMSAYFHTWCGLSANLRCRSETCCTRLTENTERKKSPKIAIWAPSHNFVGLYLRKKGMYRQPEKLIKQQYLLHMSPRYGERRPTSGWDRYGRFGHPS